MLRRKMLFIWLLVFNLLAPCVAQIARASSVRLTLVSEPGDFVGQGGQFDISYDVDLGDVVFPEIRRRLPDGSPAELLWVLDRPSTLANDFALVFFGTDALGIPIQAGVYPDARRADFAPPGFAGLDVSFQNRGSNQVFGSFTINEVTFSPDLMDIVTFHASFLQRSESPTASALRGEFQFDRNASAPVPDLATGAQVITGCIGLIGYHRLRRRRR